MASNQHSFQPPCIHASKKQLFIFHIYYMKVKIKNGRKNTAVYKKKLRQMGFSWKSTSKNNGYWEKNCEDHEIRSIERFCRRKGLEAVVYEKNYSRGDHYRKTFFDANKGLFGNGNYYWCAYCGRIFSRKNITVDHLIPVNKVLQGKEKEKYRRKLRLHGISDVNQAENLVAACRSCNLKKSTKTGIWVLRGRMGRHGWLWVIRWTVRTVLVIMGACWIVGNGWIPPLSEKIPEWMMNRINMANAGTSVAVRKIVELLQLLQNHILEFFAEFNS